MAVFATYHIIIVLLVLTRVFSLGCETEVPLGTQQIKVPLSCRVTIYCSNIGYDIWYINSNPWDDFSNQYFKPMPTILNTMSSLALTAKCYCINNFGCRYTIHVSCRYVIEPIVTIELTTLNLVQASDDIDNSCVSIISTAIETSSISTSIINDIFSKSIIPSSARHIETSSVSTLTSSNDLDTPSAYSTNSSASSSTISDSSASSSTISNSSASSSTIPTTLPTDNKDPPYWAISLGVLSAGAVCFVCILTSLYVGIKSKNKRKLQQNITETESEEGRASMSTELKVLSSNGPQGFVNGDKPDYEDYSQPIKSPTELHDAGNNVVADPCLEIRKRGQSSLTRDLLDNVLQDKDMDEKRLDLKEFSDDVVK